MNITRAFLVLVAVALASLAACSRTDASGMFMTADEQRVVLIQLVETADHRLTGRYEQTSIGHRGVVDVEVTAIEGAAAKGELTVMLKPLSFLSAGVTMSGTISGDTLTLVARDITIRARRTSIVGYQSAIQSLRRSAAAEQAASAAILEGDRRRLAEERAKADIADRQAAIAERKMRLETGIATLGRDTARLNAALDTLPDFSSNANANTGRAAELLSTARSLPIGKRNSLIADMNRIVLETSQLEVSRNQHRLDLNGIAEQPAIIADRVTATCVPPIAAELQGVCTQGMSAAAAFEGVLTRGRTKLSGMADAIRDALHSQSQMLQEAHSL